MNETGIIDELRPVPKLAPRPDERGMPAPSIVTKCNKDERDLRELMRHIDPARMGGGL